MPLSAARGFPSQEEIEAKGFPKRIKKRGKKHPVLLALDLSTTCIGWAIGYEQEIIDFGKLVFTDGRGIGEKAVCLALYFSTLFKVYKPDRVLVERPMDRRGNVTRTHNQILGVMRYLVSRLLDIEVDEDDIINPSSIKKVLGVKKGHNHDHNKEIMVQYVNEKVGLKLKYAKSALQSDDDAADAIAILLCHWMPSE